MKDKLIPMISEKAYNLANSQNKYTFIVRKGINKIETKRLVEEKYDVQVEKVNSVVRPGKMAIDWNRNVKIRRSDMTKMIVTLKKGDKIDEFFNI